MPMKINILLNTVILSAICTFHGTGRAQSTAAVAPSEPTGIAAPAKPKRSISPEAIKRAKLTNLRKDVGLTAEQESKLKPIVDRYVDGIQATRHNPALDSRAKRQQFATLRERYNSELDAVLMADQQQKLAALKAQRLARLRAGRAGSVTGVSESQEQPASSPAVH